MNLARTTLVQIASAATVVAAAGCGSDDRGSAPAVWNGPARPVSSEAIDDFNAYAESVDEPWERSAASTASTFAQLDRIDAARKAVAGASGPSTSAREEVTVTASGLRDDSIRAERFVLELERRDDRTWRIRSATWSQRCQPGRGHQSFSAELCR